MRDWIDADCWRKGEKLKVNSKIFCICKSSRNISKAMNLSNKMVLPMNLGAN